MTSRTLPPLIPRSVIFGNPEMDAAQVSPDGKMIAYLAPVDGKLAVWVRTIGQGDDRVVAQDAIRPIPSAKWQGDGEHILYLQDSGGDENYHLFRVDLLGGEARILRRAATFEPCPWPSTSASPMRVWSL
jgi:Tol biopolymer transport system component